jgi:mRNA-degrading endonuclease RelE of RelBE toxin-antitoxin system
MKYKVSWSNGAKNELKKLDNILSNAKLDAIYNSPEQIVFPEQFQIDEYRKDCRRIIVGNYKVLYQFKNNEIRIVKVFNSLHDPINSLV